MSRRDHRFIDNHHHLSPRRYNQINPVLNIQAARTGGDQYQLRQLLAKELAGNDLYAAAWRKATEHLKIKKQSSPGLFSATVPEQFYIALIAYTLEEPPLHADFNSKLRQITGEPSWNRFQYKSFYLLLSYAKVLIEPNDPKINQTIYRGIKNHFDVDPKAGDRFYFDYFASFSTDVITAEVFADGKGTLIRLDCPHGAHQPYGAMGIRNFSIFPNENEVIVMPCNRLKVIKFDKTGRLHKLWLEFQGIEIGQ